ncbi:hypothetical protein B0T20DRAFT_409291 [Sordaria brevicollis]|uniref:Uncharacterized protein n=1 Tax=Sordaria brevicollis TaxID=83679 RepID=A0AAE0UCK2_SORBR|nr:hypothetical protein B0T20DRAFT_409291 [Sordaria brevicollis]
MPSNMQANPGPLGTPNDGILDSRLSKVWELLGIKIYSPEATDKAFKDWQDDVRYWIRYNGNDEDLGKDHFPKLEKGLKAWGGWNDSSTSSILILAAENKGSDASYCWLSPVAVRMAQAIREEKETQKTSPGRPTCAVYQWKWRNSVSTMLLQVLCQLLDQNQHVLQDGEAYNQISKVVEGIKEAVQVPKQTAESKDSGIDESLVETIGQILLQVVEELKETGILWIVLDRIEYRRRGARPSDAFGESLDQVG